jgi:TonB family protein
MSENWNEWEGRTVNGQFPLLRYLGGPDCCAVFLTERNEKESLEKAAIKIVPASTDQAELLLARWRRAAELTHPHLVALYEMGRFEIGRVTFAYVVMESAEENLAQALSWRALTTDEAREMLACVLEVLAFLHAKGFVHGHIKPSNIMASGDQMKIASDGLVHDGESLEFSGNQNPYDPPELASGNVSGPQASSPAGDVWSLGMTLVEALTQELPVWRADQQQDPLVPQTLPQPFLDIARHCLARRPQDRWTVAQIAARLENRSVVPQVRTMPRSIETTPLEARTPMARTPEVRSPAPAPQPVIRPSRPPAKRPSYAVPLAIGFVLVVAAILAGTKLLHRNTDAPQTPSSAVEEPMAPQAPIEAPSQAPTSPQERSTDSFYSSLAHEERSPKAPVPVPAIVHPETAHNQEADAVAKLSGGSGIRGEVAQRVMPEVLESARNSIRGTVRVSVKVNVDRSGNVEDAELESPGPSKYFAQAALKAARLWKFNPPTAGGRGVLSGWTLHFQFTRDETTVVPSQEMP